MMDPRQASIERLRAALSSQGLDDPTGSLIGLPGLATATEEGANPANDAELGGRLVAMRRQLNRPMPGGPAPDKRWDRFFGAMQIAELRANAAGKNFRINTDGFGTNVAQDQGTGKYYNNDIGEIAPGQLATKERNAYYADRPDEALKGAQAVRRFKQNQSVPTGRI